MKIKLSFQNKYLLIISTIILILSFVFLQSRMKKEEAVINLNNFDQIYKADKTIRLVGENDRENGFKVDIIDDAKKMEQGLMFINVMKPENGLLFDFKNSQNVSFWMKNTYIPLDIIFITEDNIISSISKNTQILNDKKTYTSIDKVRYVLEINAGLSDRLGIQIGDKLIID
jgi:uncharacterized membrane protein (UPF0127 family)